MDDYAFQQELESMAANAWIQPSSHDDNQAHGNDPCTDNLQYQHTEPIGTTMKRWQSCFALSPDDAVERILAHRSNLTRPRLSDEHWNSIQISAEADGHDRESYEYELWMQQKRANLSTSTSTSAVAPQIDEKIRYLVELNGPLGNVEKLMAVLDIDESPEIRRGFSVETGGAVEVACVDARAKAKIMEWTTSNGAGSGGGGGWEPTVLVDPRSL